MEITKALYLSNEEQSMLDMHTLLNIVNVIIGELTLLQVDLDGNADLQHTLKLANRLKDTLSEKDRTQFTKEAIQKFRNELTGAIHKLKGPITEHRSLGDFTHFERNMKNILSIMDVRVDELLARWKFPDQWLTFNEEQLRKEITDFLHAMEVNSNGRYRMVYNMAEQGDDTYLIHLDIQGTNGEIQIPFAMKDVLRDLTANARKYSDPGSRIDIAVHQKGQKLLIIVEDNGHGIPQEDIERIFDFGERASNTGEVRSLGGSFGLTKALETTRHFHGRMWVDSKVGHGTKIKIEVPVYL